MRSRVAPLINASRLTASENLATPLAFRDVLLSIAVYCSSHSQSANTAQSTVELLSPLTSM